MRQVPKVKKYKNCRKTTLKTISPYFHRFKVIKAFQFHKYIRILAKTKGTTLTRSPVFSIQFMNMLSKNEGGNSDLISQINNARLNVLYFMIVLNYMICHYHVLFTLHLSCKSINKEGKVLQFFLNVDQIVIIIIVVYIVLH